MSFPGLNLGCVRVTVPVLGLRREVHLVLVRRSAPRRGWSRGIVAPLSGGGEMNRGRVDGFR